MKVPFGKTMIEAESEAEAQRVARLILNLNAKSRVDARTEEFAVCIRQNDEWTRLAAGPEEAFECAVLAASIATSDPNVIAAVFSLGEDGTHEGPHLVFGAPHAVLASWVSDSGDGEHAELAKGAEISVLRNAERILISRVPMVMPGSDTEH